jgi:hypothetical protein
MYWCRSDGSRARAADAKQSTRREMMMVGRKGSERHSDVIIPTISRIFRKKSKGRDDILAASQDRSHAALFKPSARKESERTGHVPLLSSLFVFALGLALPLPPSARLFFESALCLAPPASLSSAPCSYTLFLDLPSPLSTRQLAFT